MSSPAVKLLADNFKSALRNNSIKHNMLEDRVSMLSQKIVFTIRICSGIIKK